MAKSTSSEAEAAAERPPVQCPDIIRAKVRQFAEQEISLSDEYSEAQLRVDFINPMLYALGWDVENREGRHEAYREVVYEDAVKAAPASASSSLKRKDHQFPSALIRSRRSSCGATRARPNCPCRS
jgi:hypothetical protein